VTVELKMNGAVRTCSRRRLDLELSELEEEEEEEDKAAGASGGSCHTNQACV
jgi:hypothetical protein